MERKTLLQIYIYIDVFPYKPPLSSEIFQPRLIASTSPKKAHEKEESEAGGQFPWFLGLESRGKSEHSEHC